MEKKKVPAERSEKGPSEKRQCDGNRAVQCNGNRQDRKCQRFGDNPVKALCWVKPEFIPGTESVLGKIIDFFPEGSFSRMMKADAACRDLLHALTNIECIILSASFWVR